ncbi:hypothetical protein [Microvirga massiliensis]|uniref:hypothetical protein n=1 Tax=Microvirga massiliensis TaxID=1033741 RepID=UPI00062BA8AE|nr:hypothetical protein [Microvirga massiliensis]
MLLEKDESVAVPLLAEKTETIVGVLVPLQAEEIDAVAGGVSIYVDGMYQGEGSFDYWPWPGGHSMSGAPVVFK